MVFGFLVNYEFCPWDLDRICHKITYKFTVSEPLKIEQFFPVCDYIWNLLARQKSVSYSVLTWWISTPSDFSTHTWEIFPILEFFMHDIYVNWNFCGVSQSLVWVCVLIPLKIFKSDQLNGRKFYFWRNVNYPCEIQTAYPRAYPPSVKFSKLATGTLLLLHALKCYRFSPLNAVY